MADMAEVQDLVTRTLSSHPTLFLSTTSNDEPWGTGAFFAESDPFTLRLVLEQTGRTLRNVHANPTVAIVVSTGNPYEPFLQGSAGVVVLESVDEVEATKAALIAKAPAVEPILGAPIVAVQLEVTTWKATDIRNGWLPALQLIAPQRAPSS